MSVRATYVIFDGDKDKYAYAFLKGWKVNESGGVRFSGRPRHWRYDRAGSG